MVDWDLYDSVETLGIALIIAGVLLDLFGFALSPLGYIGWWPPYPEGIELTILGFVLWPVGVALYDWARTESR